MKNIIEQYIYRRSRDEKGRRVRIGMLVAGRRSNGKVYIGWSKCKMSEDTFDREEGLRIAMERFNDPYEKTVPLDSMRRDILRFAARCVMYFQVTDIRIA